MRSVWILVLFLCLIVKATVPAPESNSTQCEPPNTKCQTGECIPIERICDGIFDCSDGEDEMNCTIAKTEECPPKHSPCADNEYCVPNILLCDGEKDCFDGSDEAYCEARITKVSCFAYGSIICRTTELYEQNVCHPQNVTCNGIRECPLGDDEENCEDLKGCAVREQKCHHFCEDRPISFVCGCAEGYKLESDGHSCRYESEKSSAGYIFVSSVSEVYRIPLANVYGEENYTIIHDFGHDIVGHMGYMRQTNELFMMVMPPSSTQLWDLRVLSNGRVKTLRENIYEEGSIAVDWIGKNVFFTQDFRSSFKNSLSKSPGIHVCTMNGLFCRRIIEGNTDGQLYRGLVVHPTRGLILWIDYNKQKNSPTRIMMSNMDGSNVRSLIESSSKKPIDPTTLAIDHVKNDVYFINKRWIERINIDTKEIHAVFSHHLANSFDMVYLNGFLYWSEWHPKTSLMVQEVAHNHSSAHIAHKLKLFSFHIAVNHSLHQIEPSLNPCHELDCPWLCIVIPKSSSGGITAKCICPDGYTLSGDTCMPFSPFDEMEILKNYSHIGFELMSEYCKKGIGCKNGGSCRQILNETRIVCDCKPPFDGQYCERFNPAMHAATKEFKTQFSVYPLFFICILILLIVGCGALVKFAKRKFNAASSPRDLIDGMTSTTRDDTSPLVNKEKETSSRVNLESGESGIQMENLPTSFNNSSSDETPETPSAESFSSTISTGDDGSLL